MALPTSKRRETGRVSEWDVFQYFILFPGCGMQLIYTKLHPCFGILHKILEFLFR